MARQYTREAIRNTFIQMLNERPLSKITVKDIVATCEINRNTFYYYYADIYAIIEEIFQMELQTVKEEYNDTLSWEESFLVAINFAIKNKKAIYHIYHSIQKERVEEYLYHVAGRVMTYYVEQESKKIRASKADKELIISFYQSALTGMLLRWIASDMKADPDKIIRRIGQLFNGNIASSLHRSETLDGSW
ncbi:MAG TPA: TetR family transcriptional regulator C-terminal domain-containing protein [Candidatus Fimimorpha faecalis]|uniref:TetR family transcriptional regulator C-terminal domain-containing protein n=1 Tax=Candidatus Fimimorpha faecalis TaxID=2840824 RepID=A0A9D1EDN9_9FIRM|nr:TetR family transcriptional regulator C-terminal domain-containing protein [Candidatus Fimimorpha faecalis]